MTEPTMDTDTILLGAFPGQSQRAAFLRCCVKRAARSASFDFERHAGAWAGRFPEQPAVTSAERQLVATTLWFVS